MPDSLETKPFLNWLGKPWSDAVLLFVASLTLYLVGNGGFSLIERDETGFVSRSSNMWKTGQWLVPEILGEKFYDKPILVFWMQAPVLGLLGDNNFAARLPSAICGALAVVLVYWFGRQLVYYGAPARWQTYDSPPIRRLQRLVGGVAALLMGTALLFVFISKWAACDALLLLVTLAMVSLMFLLIFDPPNRSRLTTGHMPNAWDFPITWFRAYGLAVLGAVSVLLKGPANLAFLVPMGIALLVFFRPWRALRPWRMWVLAGLFSIALVVPYFWTVAQLTKGQFANRFLVQQVLQRLFIADNGHFGPPGYYTLTSLISFYPWGLLFVWALAGPLTAIWRAWQKRRADRRALRAAQAAGGSAAEMPVGFDPTRSGLLNRVARSPSDEPAVLHSSSDTLIPSPVAGLDSVVLFLLCYFVPGWLFVEVVMVTKLPHYIMPAFPALALLLAWRVVDWTVVRRTTTLGQTQSLLTSGQWVMGSTEAAGAPADLHPASPALTASQPVATEPFFRNVHLRRLAVISTLLPVLLALVLGVLMFTQGAWLALGGCILLAGLAVAITLVLWPAVFAGEPLRGIVRTVPLMAAGMVAAYLLVLPGFEPLRLEVQAAKKISELTPPEQPVLLVNWKSWATPFYTARPTFFVRTTFPARQGGPTLKPLVEFLQKRDPRKPLTVLLDADARRLVAQSPELLARFPQLDPEQPGWKTVTGYEHAGVNLSKGWQRTLWLTVLPAE